MTSKVLPGLFGMMNELRCRDFTRRERDLLEAVLCVSATLGIGKPRIDLQSLCKLSRIGIKHIDEVIHRLALNNVLKIERTKNDGVFFEVQPPLSWKVTILQSSEEMILVLRGLAEANALRQGVEFEEPNLNAEMANVIAATERRMPPRDWLPSLRAAANGDYATEDCSTGQSSVSAVENEFPKMGNSPIPQNGERSCSPSIPQNGECGECPANIDGNAPPEALFPKMGNRTRNVVHVNVSSKERKTFNVSAASPTAADVSWLESELSAWLGPREWERYGKQWREEIRRNAEVVRVAFGEVQDKIRRGVKVRTTKGQMLWHYFKIEAGRIQFGASR